MWQMCHYCVPHIHHHNRHHLALLCWGRSLSRGTSWYSWMCTTLQSEKRTSYRLCAVDLFDHLFKYPCSSLPTSSRVVIWQANQSVARTRLAVGKAGGGDVVYHLISFCRLHLYYHLQDIITKQQKIIQVYLLNARKNISKAICKQTFCSSWSFRVFVQSNWNTMCWVKVCLMQRTTYSVSASVSCTGSEDLNNGPRPWNSGMEASCSAEWCETKRKDDAFKIKQTCANSLNILIHHERV